MKKQTKLVAVLSASALLAMGASMTSFAASGWTQENGTWYYYAKDGSRVTDEWKKSGNYWFYLGDDGEMVTDQLIEDDDDYYYVNQDGAMVTNGWVAVDNDDAGDEDEPDQYWYYFQNNGKAFKGNDNTSSVRFKTINGKKYAFDEEGKMLFGWVSEDGERQTGDDAWSEEAVYYLGDENDGAMATGWRLINILDENWSDENPYDEKYDDDQDRYFYFKSNGKRYFATSDKLLQKTINGKKYGFDQYGRMVAEWNITTAAENSATASESRTWAYFSSPEDGARKTKGWFKVTPDHDLDEVKYDDAEDFWYYGDGKGNLYANVIKTINGKKYAFDEYGRMMDGLRLIQFNTTADNKYVSTTDIAYSWKDDTENGKFFDTEDNLDATIRTLMADEDANEYAFMYFGDEDDGAVKTGKQTIVIDGDKIDFEFNKNGSKKGQGRNEVDDSDKVVYAMGKKFKADSDNKYEIVFELESGSLISLSVQDYITAAGLNQYEIRNSKDELEEYYYSKTKGDEKDCLITEYDDVKVVEGSIRVINTSGTMIKSKSKCKDGDDYLLKVKEKNITKIFTEED
ncbi:cell wall-binding protein [Clostridium sp. AM58-1XD]|nr:cell wall-binding protein [Clostridium sp. AM58-1XD]RGY94500.1 cell wall-binding protein [Clostridium sp. AM58-1XD]